MTATVLLTCDRCGATQTTTANAAGSTPHNAARAAARTLYGWAYAGTNIRLDYCPDCWVAQGGTPFGESC